MANSDRSLIEASLNSLRQRIRRVQRWRGGLMVLSTLLGGVGIAMAVDFFVGSTSATFRWSLLFLIVASLIFVSWSFFLRPLRKKITLMQVARWLEQRHPELDEKISTALYLGDQSPNIPSGLIETICEEAASEVSRFQPKVEVGVEIFRRPLIPAAVLLFLMLLVFAIWPRQASRLLLRSVAPFTDLGNAGAVYFKITPGDLEVLEGEPIDLEFTYEGQLHEPLRLLTDLGEETLTPTSSDGDEHLFHYRLAEARRSFPYHVRVGDHESDRYQVSVFPKPSLQNIRVKLAYPSYTGLPDQEAELGAGLKALVGTDVTLTGTLNTAIESASFQYGDREEILTPENQRLTWSLSLVEESPASAQILLQHRLNSEPESLTFSVTVLQDLVPQVTLISPPQESLRLKPDDEIPLVYEAVEDFGFATAEVELDSGEIMPISIPTRVDGTGEWKGSDTFELSQISQSKFKFRLKLTDNNSSNPGVGYSRWISVTLDQKASSLARQQLQASQADFEESLESARREVREAQQKMRRAQAGLEREILPEANTTALQEGRQKLAAAGRLLEALRERIQNTVQAHRSDEIQEIEQLLTAARRNLENAPLQDTADSRQSEVGAAFSESDRALEKLRELLQEVHKDRRKLRQLAKLEELAQRQEKLTQNEAHNKHWQEDQKKVSQEVRQMLRKSSPATAAALENEAARSRELAQAANEQAQAQKHLSQKPRVESLQESFQQAQRAVAQETIQELSQARKGQADNANLLEESKVLAQEVAETPTSEAARKSSKSLQAAGASPALLEAQNRIQKGLAALEGGELEKAQAVLQEQEAVAARALANEVRESPHAEGKTGNLHQAQKQSQQGADRSGQAAMHQKGGESARASEENLKASENFNETAKSLEQAASETAARAKELAAQPESENELSLPAKSMARAFEESARASSSQSPAEARINAQRSAESLKQVAQKARQAMAQGRSANSSAMAAGEMNDPSEPGDGDLPDEKEEPAPQAAQASQGVPPELAKLGISAGDWEKIKSRLKSGPGGSAKVEIPEDYRVLTQKYFQQLAQDR